MPVEKLTPERRRQLTQQTLIEAAAEVFAQKGYYGASLEEIAEVAGFTRGAIYSNFGSKEDLLLAVLDHSVDMQLQAVSGAMEAMERSDPVTDAIAATAVWETATPLGANWPALALELRLSALRNPNVRRRLAELERRSGEKTARLIEEEAQKRGWILPMPARDLADISRAAIDGLSQLAAIDDEVAPRYQGLVQTLFVLLARTVAQGGDANAPTPPRSTARSSRVKSSTGSQRRSRTGAGGSRGHSGS